MPHTRESQKGESMRIEAVTIEKGRLQVKRYPNLPGSALKAIVFLGFRQNFLRSKEHDKLHDFCNDNAMSDVSLSKSLPRELCFSGHLFRKPDNQGVLEGRNPPKPFLLFGGTFPPSF